MEAYEPTQAELSRLQNGLRIMALGALGDADLAEEIAQESMTRVVVAIREGRLRRAESLGSFARSIAHHVIVDAIRGRGTTVPLEEGANVASEEDALGALVSEEQAARVRLAMNALGPLDHEILRLSFFEGVSPQELAERLGQPGPRVRKRKERALARLRQLLFPKTLRHATLSSPTQLRTIKTVTDASARL